MFKQTMQISWKGLIILKWKNHRNHHGNLITVWFISYDHESYPIHMTQINGYKKEGNFDSCQGLQKLVCMQSKFV